VDHHRRRLCAPSMMELGRALGCNAAVAGELARHLVNKGYLEPRASGSVRNLWPTAVGWKEVRA
jgi:hypothetical protein